MAIQSNAPTTVFATDSLGFNPASFSHEERDIAMDAIAQIIPHLDLQDCRQIAELVDAQTTLIEILGDRQSVCPVPLKQYSAA